mmetsp:Transcript_34328/g.94853  ORF Transcript_34328/g.94853 Transcript_34328/m.94853 type:complete len:208 (+) Transcript_34328:1366-1989(+)
MHLFRSFLTTSYMVQNSFCFWLISWCFFLRSSSSSCFIATSSAVSRHWRCMFEASRASFSRFEASVLKCVAQCCSSSLSFFSSFCMSSICWVISSYSFFLSCSNVSCFRKAPMKRSTSAWMSSSSFFCRRMSSSCCFICLLRSFWLVFSGPRASETLSLLIWVRLYWRLSFSNCFCSVEFSPWARRASVLSSSSSWSRLRRFMTSSW